MQRRTTVSRILIKACLLLLLSAVLLTSAAYAWLREGFITPDSEISFTTGKPTPPPIAMWTYTSEAEDEELAAANRWVSQTVTTVDNGNTVPGVASSVTDNKYTFTLTSLHLGTVDNLILLTNDNYVYLRVLIDPVALGNSVEVTLSLKPSDGIELFDSTGAPISDEVSGEDPQTPLADLYAIDAVTPLLRIDYTVSKTEYTPITMTAALEESFTTVGDNTIYTAPDNDPYYIYLRIHPNLSAFMEATRFLYVYMPCTLLYSLDVSLLIYEAAV